MVECWASASFLADSTLKHGSVSQVGQLVGWSVGQLVTQLVPWLVCWSISQSVNWSASVSVGRLVVWSVGWSVGWSVCWLVGWTVGWSVSQLVSLSVSRSFSQLVSRVFGVGKSFSPLMCAFVGFVWCTIVAFMILQKLRILEKFGAGVISKNALGQSDCKIF